MRKRIYICGPMSGYENHNYPAFHHAEKVLSAGWSVLNPASNFKGREDLDYDTYIREDLKLLSFADAIVLLEGWKQSKGCILELHIAWVLGLDIYEWNVYDELQSLFADPHELILQVLISKKFWVTVDELLDESNV